MSRSTVQPNGWVALRLPSENVRVIQVVPNTTISLGKYGQFPSNLIIERPYYITYEVQDKQDGESFCRLRVVPGVELSAAQLVDTTVEDVAAESNTDAQNGEIDGDNVIVPADGEELTLVDESGKIVARSNREIIDDSARQTLTTDEIEELKQKGAAAGKDIIAKLLLSHTAIDKKTAYSLAKYKLLKEKKYMRRFTVLPLDVAQLAQWLLEDRDASKILEMRQEMIGLVGCWADIHFGGEPIEGLTEPHGGRWLVMDDTGGLLVAGMAERMGILYQQHGVGVNGISAPETQEHNGTDDLSTARDGDEALNTSTTPASRSGRKRPRIDDLEDHYAHTNTITLIHSNSQPNLSLLRYFDYDASEANPQYPFHPLFTNLLPISWLQLLQPQHDNAYCERPADMAPEELAASKTSRRANYHRKRRRWARTRQIVDSARAGGFAGLAVASTMEPVSVLRHALPLLNGGAPVAIYSPTVEPLTQLADCFSIGRRSAWMANPPAETEGQTLSELENWPGSEEFPLNPTLLLGTSIQTSRARRWQVLPGRTHPFMMGRGGAEGYVFTGWKTVRAEGRISARGKFNNKKRVDGT